MPSISLPSLYADLALIVLPSRLLRSRRIPQCLPRLPMIIALSKYLSVRSAGWAGRVTRSLGYRRLAARKNVIAALKTARETGLVTIGFTGETRGAMHEICDLILSAPSSETAMIQQIHIVAAHAICGSVEHELFGNAIKSETATRGAPRWHSMVRVGDALHAGDGA